MCLFNNQKGTSKRREQNKHIYANKRQNKATCIFTAMIKIQELQSRQPLCGEKIYVLSIINILITKKMSL
jgi:hypothetical protein